MLDQLLTPALWKDQFAVVMSPPWVNIPPILIAGLFGWLLRGMLNRGQIRAFKADLKARDERLQLARLIEHDVAEKLAVAKADGEQLKKRVGLYKSVDVGFVAIQSSVGSTIAAIDKASTYSDVLRDTLNPPPQ